MVHHCVLVDAQDARRVAYAAAVEHMFVDLVAYAQVVGPVAVAELEAATAAIALAAPALVAVGPVTVLDRVGAVAVRAQDWLNV